MKKKVYLIYGGDDIPYEPTFVVKAFESKDKAEKCLENLKKENEELIKKSSLYSTLADEYYDFLYSIGNPKNDAAAIAEHFGVTESYANEVLDFFYCPQFYTIVEQELNDEDY